MLHTISLLCNFNICRTNAIKYLRNFNSDVHISSIEPFFNLTPFFKSNTTNIFRLYHINGRNEREILAITCISSSFPL